MAGSVYGAVGDFSISANPNGQWQYLWNNGSGAALLTDAVPSPAGGVTGLEGWLNDPNNSIPELSLIGKNISGSTLSYVTIVQPTNLLRMDGQANSVIVQWTATSAGVCSIAGLFQGIDTNEHAHTVEILENSSTMLLAPVVVSSFGQMVPFTDHVSLNAGDTISFIEDGTTDGFNLSTGLAATISSVPEPSSLVLVAIAIGACGSLSWWRGRRT